MAAPSSDFPVHLEYNLTPSQHMWPLLGGLPLCAAVLECDERNLCPHLFLAKIKSNTLSKPWYYHFSIQMLTSWTRQRWEMKQWDTRRRGTFTAPWASSPPSSEGLGKERCLLVNWPWRAGPSLCWAGFPTELPLKGQRDWKPTTLLPWPNKHPSTISTEKQLWENAAALTSITSGLYQHLGTKTLNPLSAPIM